MTITRDKLCKLLTYFPNNGEFVWNERENDNSFNKRYAGRQAGSFNKKGYRTILICGKSYPAAKLAYLFQRDQIPFIVDHIDRNPSNNSWNNLRKATARQNACNKRHKHSNYFLGVRKTKNHKWTSTVYYYGKAIRIGTFAKFDDAQKARVIASEQMYGDFTPHRKLNGVSDFFKKLIHQTINKKINALHNKGLKETSKVKLEHLRKVLYSHQ